MVSKGGAPATCLRVTPFHGSLPLLQTIHSLVNWGDSEGRGGEGRGEGGKGREGEREGREGEGRGGGRKGREEEGRGGGGEEG